MRARVSFTGRSGFRDSCRTTGNASKSIAPRTPRRGLAHHTDPAVSSSGSSDNPSRRATGAPGRRLLQLELGHRPEILTGREGILPLGVVIQQHLTLGGETGLGLVEAKTQLGKLTLGRLGHARTGRRCDSIQQVMQLITQ